MQNKLNKKALSEVIAISFMIVITIISITLIGSTVIQKIDLSPEISCTELQIKKVINIESSCYDEENNRVISTVKRSLDNIDINNIKFTLLSGEESTSYICDGLNGYMCGVNCLIPEIGETKKFYLGIQNNQPPNNMLIKVNECALQEITVLPSC